MIKITKPFPFIIVILVVAFLVVSLGINNFMKGINVGVKNHGGNMCDFINKTMDEEGYCILKENSTYNIKVDCQIGKFRIIGKREMNSIELIAYFPQKIIYYPALRCW